MLKAASGESTYQDVISKLVHNELFKTHAFTKDGYAPIGAVLFNDKDYFVIKDIQGDRVLLDNGAYGINGAGGIWSLTIAAMSVEAFDKGLIK